MSARPAGAVTGTLTILFTDIVESTRLRVRLGEERAETHRQVHHRLLAQAIAAHRGTLHDDLGDGIMASFPGAADAVTAAVAIQQAIEAVSRGTDQVGVGVRIGISAGDVDWDGARPHGMPLVEASRLCGAAEGGQILVAEIVRVLARGRGGHTFAPVGPLALKGLPESLVACAVSWEPLEDVGFPLPPRLATRSRFAMVGRSAETEALALAWAKAKDGQRQVVLIAGEPGIGKTRLATEAARAAHADGGVVLFGACDEDVALPYRPFVEALRHYVTHASAAVLATHLCTHRGELARLVPELARRLPDLPAPQAAEAETERFLLFEAVTGLLATASQESPIVLVLDDLHWAVAPELLLLKHLVRSAEPMRLLVIGTYRDTDLSRTHPLTAMLADLRKEGGVERVSLHGLDDDAVEALVAAVTRHELDEALVALARVVRRETEGNPFFMGEVVRHLIESGALFQERGRWTYRGAIAELGIPEGVREVIGRRLGRLSEATSRVLGLAAVIGPRFDVALLATIAETSEDAVLDALEEATAAALVTEVRGSPDTFTFRHALIRTTLYEELSAPRRARLHQRVGEGLEALVQATPGARIEELAYHWLAATRTADVGKAIAYARQAADRALAGLAFEEAAAHFARALAVLEPRDVDGERLRCDLLLALADAQRRAGDTTYRETVAQAVAAARALGDGERLALAALASARPGGFLASFNLVDEGLISLYEEANGALGDADSLLRARMLGQLAVELTFATAPRERRDALSREAVEIARRLGDRTGLAQVLILRLLAIHDPFTLAERLGLIAELGALARELGSSELAWHAALHGTCALLESGDIAGAERAVAEVERLAGELRQPFYTWFARLEQTAFALMRGAPDAEAQVFATFELGMAGGQPDAPVALAGQLAILRHNQGRYAELADLVRANTEATAHASSVARAALARFYCEMDQCVEAREQVEILRANDFYHPLNWALGTYLVNVSEVVSDLHDRSASELLYERLRPLAGQVLAAVVGCAGSFALWCGMLAACLGRWDDAECHFADALTMNERLGARPYAVRTRRAWAAMLLDRAAPGDTARVKELIAAGLAEAGTLGMAREIVRLERLLARVESVDNE
jgi:class 3 adenylate cyclase